MDKTSFKKEVEALKLKIRRLQKSIRDNVGAFEGELLQVCRDVRTIEKEISVNKKAIEKKIEEQIKILEKESKELDEFKRPFLYVGMGLESLSKSVRKREIELMRKEDPDYPNDEEESDEEYQR